MASTEITVVDSKGKKSGTRQVAERLTSTEPKKALLHQTVRWQRSKRRAGTHSTRTRAEVTGGGTKPWKQKGTGRARAGSNTSPLWVGGGIAHGPKPRSYEFSMNKKERKLALAGAISARSAEGALFVVKSFGLSKPKTKDACAVLSAIGVPEGEKAVVVVPRADEVTWKSVRNIRTVRVVAPEGLNVYDILNARYLVLTEDALSAVEARVA